MALAEVSGPKASPPHQGPQLLGASFARSRVCKQRLTSPERCGAERIETQGAPTNGAYAPLVTAHTS